MSCKLDSEGNEADIDEEGRNLKSRLKARFHVQVCCVITAASTRDQTLYATENTFFLTALLHMRSSRTRLHPQ